MYSSPYIIRPPLWPEKYAVNLELVLNQRDIYIEKYKNGVTDRWS